MTLADRLQRAYRLPPRVLLRKIAARVLRGLEARRTRRRDQQAPTYQTESTTFDTELPCHFRVPALASLRREANQIRTLADRFLEHRFDLLGSGWVKVAHGIACRGVEGHRYPARPTVSADPEGAWLAGRINPANLPDAQRLWQAVDPEYRPIDWHLDYKSGWRWSEAVWSPDIRYGNQAGADVKVPWELARMQHLPMLAWAHVLDGERTTRYVREFRNQVLDFLAANPPRFGVNWVCTMDVAIRICNWLAAYDLFRASGAVFDSLFRSVFHRAVHEHAHHIAHHLEWGPDLRGNHYLADIVGLIFATTYLPRSPRTDTWLALGVRELVNEVPLQFGNDGSNFEASCTYHRLSAEMVVCATALVLGLPANKQQALQEYDRRLFSGPPALPPAPVPLHAISGSDRLTPFPPWYFERLERMARFTADITRHDGLVPQFGDNDSGRFLKLRPEGAVDQLNHAGLVEAIAGIVVGDQPSGPGEPSGWESEIIPLLSRTPRIKLPARVNKTVASDGLAELCRYPDFGLFIYRTSNVYLAVRCGPNGQNDNGGHAHNDQLSLELAVDGIPLLVDPGTYLYTPLPHVRNRFRSTAMHNTLAIPGREQNPLLNGPGGLFRLTDRARAMVRCCEPDRFSGEHHGFGAPCRRTLQIHPGTIGGIDECTLDGPKDVWFHLAPGFAVKEDKAAEGWLLVAGEEKFAGGTSPHSTRRTCVRLEAAEGRWEVEKSLYSPGYGLVESCLALRLRSEAWRIEWRIHLACQSGESRGPG